MKPRKVRDIQRALLSKGFEVDNSHHEIYWLVIDGKKTSVNTKVSHGETECKPGILRKMAKQMRVSNEAFLDFVDCHLSGQGYAAGLIESGAVRL